MRKILVLQHVASEPLGHLDALLRRSGIRIRYVNFGRDPHARPDVARYDGLVVLGGPMNVDQVDHHPHLRTEIDVIREAVQRGKPVLGVCLGAQLLAAAMGAAVHPNPVPEIGWYRLRTEPAAHEDRLFRHFERKACFVFQWHAYTCQVPAGAVHLASTCNASRRSAPTRACGCPRRSRSASASSGSSSSSSVRARDPSLFLRAEASRQPRPRNIR